MRLVEPSAREISNGGRASGGIAFLVEEKRPHLSVEMCEKFVTDGADCLVVSRDPASQLLGDSYIEPKRSIWLTNLVGKDRMNPTAIGILMGEIRKFIEQSGRAIILMDGLEYLISVNTYDRMLQFINQLRDVIVTESAILIVPIDARTLSERELAMLERNLQVILPGQEGESAENAIHLPSGEIVTLGQR